MVGFKNDSLDKIYRGKTIAEASSMRNQSPEETIVDLVIEDDSRIQCVYYSMSEENLRKKISLPWVSFVQMQDLTLTLKKILEPTQSFWEFCKSNWKIFA